MNNNKYNRGELRTDRNSRNRFVSSYDKHYKTVSYIAIIVAILALIAVTCLIFSGFWKEFIPVGNIDGNIEQPNPKPSYIASEGGDDLSDVYLYSEYAILVKVSDMTTIAHQGADTVIYPASMTKVMTVLVALDHIENIDDEYVINEKAINQMDPESSNAGLKYYIGSKVSVRDLLYGVSYESAADSVFCLIDYLGFTMKEFVSLMNEKAKEIGMQNTTFGGAIGMDYEYNQTTCRDIAGMMVYAMENPLCLELFGGTKYQVSTMDRTYYNGTLWTNVNDFDTVNFNATPENIISGYNLLAAKSGFETKAGYCLVSYLENDETGEKFVLVTANAPHNKSPYRKARILDMQTLFDLFNP